MQQQKPFQLNGTKATAHETVQYSVVYLQNLILQLSCYFCKSQTETTFCPFQNRIK